MPPKKASKLQQELILGELHKMARRTYYLEKRVAALEARTCYLEENICTLESICQGQNDSRPPDIEPSLFVQFA